MSEELLDDDFGFLSRFIFKLLLDVSKDQAHLLLQFKILLRDLFRLFLLLNRRLLLHVICHSYLN